MFTTALNALQTVIRFFCIEPFSCRAPYFTPFICGEQRDKGLLHPMQDTKEVQELVIWQSLHVPIKKQEHI